MLSEEIWKIVVCPACGAILERTDLRALCTECNAEYSTPRNGQPDLRIRGSKDYALNVVYSGDHSFPEPSYAPLEENASAQFDYRDIRLTRRVATGNRLNRELLSYFPRATSPGGKMLDLGCGDAQTAEICRGTNLEYVGVDYASGVADMLADAHALPFVDQSFDFVLSVAVLEHLRYPHIALRETFRVLKPGGLFLGTVAFLEIFHMESFYHHTHLGTANALASAGFDVKRVAPNIEWTGLRAITNMAFFPQLPFALTKLFVFPLQALHRAWHVAERIVRPHNGRTKENLTLWTTGGFQFIAVKPGATT